MKKLILVLALLLLFMAVPPVMAVKPTPSVSLWDEHYEDDSVEFIQLTTVHDVNYIPVEYEYLLIVIGLVCLAISRIVRDAEDIFSVGAVIPLGLSAWFANFITVENYAMHTLMESNSTAIQANDTVHVIYTQMITPFPSLSIVMIVFTILAVINVIWIFFLQPADKGMEYDKK